MARKWKYLAGCAVALGAAFFHAGAQFTPPGGGGSGSVTSVGLTGTTNQITVTGASPITGAGSWTLSLPTGLVLPTLGGDALFTDATYDIGKSGATRPRDFFLSRNGTIGGTLAVTGHATLEGVTSTGATGTGLIVFGTSPTITSPVITNIAPGADFTLTQNSVAALTSVSSGAVVNTIYLTAGHTLLGTTTDLGAILTVADTRSTSPRGMLSLQNSDDTNGARVGFSKSRGTAAAPTIVVTGDTLGRSMYRGYDGSNYLEMASIEAVSTGTIAVTRVPTYLAFSTATNATPSVLTEAARINATQNLLIGGTTEQNYKLSVEKSGTTGTANFQDLTASTGATRVNIGLGAADSASTVVSTVAGSQTVSGNAIFGSTGTASNNVRVISGSSQSGANLIDFYANNNLTNLLSVDYQGSIVSAGALTAGATAYITFAGRSLIRSPSNGVFTVSNQAENDFGRLQFGGTTSSFPALKRSTTKLLVRLADDSADAEIDMSTVNISSSSFTFNGHTCTIVSTVVTCP